MELTSFFKSAIDEDRSAVVICNLEHEIINMNPAAVERYHKRGGAALLGANLLNCHNAQSVELIHRIIEWFQQSREHNRIYLYHNEKENMDGYMVALRDEQGGLIGYYEKHEYRNPETEAFYKFD